MGSGLAFCSRFPRLFKHTILGLDTFMISDEIPDEKEKMLWETVACFVVLKSPMKLVTGGIKVRESLGWILGLVFLRCSFPGSKRPQLNVSQVKDPKYNMIAYYFLCLTKTYTCFLQKLLNKCFFSLSLKKFYLCVWMYLVCGCPLRPEEGATFLRDWITCGYELHMDAVKQTQVF